METLFNVHVIQFMFGSSLELIGEKSAQIMDDLVDDWPLTGGGEMTFESMDNYLPILIGD